MFGEEGEQHFFFKSEMPVDVLIHHLDDVPQLPQVVIRLRAHGDVGRRSEDAAFEIVQERQRSLVLVMEHLPELGQSHHDVWLPCWIARFLMCVRARFATWSANQAKKTAPIVPTMAPAVMTTGRSMAMPTPTAVRWHTR